MSIYKDIRWIVENTANQEQLEKYILDYITKTILADLYKESYPAVGRLCDEKLDCSGALLGRVRNIARTGNE